MSAMQAGEDRRLATLHLRLGGLGLALAELEDLRRRGELDAPGLADLGEVRWRSGELDAAAEAAAEHLAAGGSRPIAHVIAAEAAAAAGRPVEARTHVDAFGQIDAEALERLFAGMPRRAVWPSAPSAPIGPPTTMFEADRTAGRRTVPTPERRVAGPGGTAEADAAASLPGLPPMAGLWGDEDAALLGDADSDRGAEPHTAPGTPADELSRARAELASGDPADAARGLARLALVLRLEPGLAIDVLGAVETRRDVEALLVRGDAARLLGRHLEAEAAFAAAARGLAGRGPSRPA